MIMQHGRNPAPSSTVHEIGVQLSIGDFGTGDSGFANHRRFPVRRLRIEQSMGGTSPPTLIVPASVAA